jgi:hypothetical protein
VLQCGSDALSRDRLGCFNLVRARPPPRACVIRAHLLSAHAQRVSVSKLGCFNLSVRTSARLQLINN